MALCVLCQSGGELPIFVRKNGPSDARQTPMEINSDATVAELKKKIAAEFGIDNLDHRSLLLESSGRPINDLRESLADAGIGAEAVDIGKIISCGGQGGGRKLGIGFHAFIPVGSGGKQPFV